MAKRLLVRRRVGGTGEGRSFRDDLGDVAFLPRFERVRRSSWRESFRRRLLFGARGGGGWGDEALRWLRVEGGRANVGTGCDGSDGSVWTVEATGIGDRMRRIGEVGGTSGRTGSAIAVCEESGNSVDVKKEGERNC